ncbi:MAG: peptidylprolyl isomerase [Clostridia bacterium]|nr:peptidylprolyl isomerase [Clostridia bacterium]
MKKIIALILAFMLLSSICAGAKGLEFQMGSNTMYERNEKIESFEIETAPYTKNGRTMVPVRIISERFGALVGWNGEKQEVSIKKDGKEIILNLGSDIAYVNGEAIKLDAAPEEIGGRTMVPIRFISENLGMKVKYIAPTEHVYITDEDAVMTVNGVDIFADTFISLLPNLGVDISGDSLEILLPQAIDLIGSVYASASYYQNKGEKLIIDETESFKSMVEEYNNIEEKFFLVSPFIDAVDCDSFMANFFRSKISEEDFDSAKKWYAENYMSAKHILVTFEGRTKAEAKKIIDDIYKKAKKGSDFDSLIEKYGEDPGMQASPEGYTFTKGEMVKEFEDATLALKDNQISPVIETSYGYHIVKRIPLGEISQETAAKMAEEFAYQRIMDEAIKGSEIKVHKTIPELAKMINNK